MLKNTVGLKENQKILLGNKKKFMSFQIIKLSDNLKLLKKLESNSIDLIYGDVLYGTGRDFVEYKDLNSNYEEVFEFYNERLLECKRVLKYNGCCYFQMDTRINHWFRLIMDKIFGYNNFRNEISWCYNSQGKSTNYWNKKHDVILFYTKSNTFTFNSNIIKDSITNSTYRRFKNEIDKKGYYTSFKNGKEYKYYLKDGSLPKDWFEDITYLSQENKELTNYPTQKPQELLRRIILASTNINDLVLDIFLGSGTTAVVCKKENRNFIGCDININSINITNERLKNTNNKNYDILNNLCEKSQKVYGKPME